MLTILHGDALTQMRTLEAESAQACITSPPYFGLRSYGTTPLVWDVETDCDHEFVTLPDKRNRHGETITLSDKQWTNRGTAWPIIPAGAKCRHCSAWCGELGLEPSVEGYVRHLVAIFSEVRRVLRKDGTLFLNVGDSYAGSGNGWQKSDCSIPRPWLDSNRPGDEQGRPPSYISSRQSNGIKPKDLIGVPWRVAFALQESGWYLRSEITWCKRAPMPESVTDRPTSATEKIFLFSKSEKYLYNRDEVRLSPLDAEDDARRILYRTLDRQKSNPTETQNGLRPRKTDKQRGHSRRHAGFNDRWDLMTKAEQMAGGANLRNYWVLGPDPFPEAHFATFPREIPKRCILLGSNAGDVVLDPFAGSGTTGKVAIELGRKAILIEPKAEYVEMIERRCKTTIGLPLVTRNELSLETENEEQRDALALVN